MRRLNYVVEVDRDSGKTIREADVATCGHCLLQMFLPPPKNGQLVVRVGPTCALCRRYICNVCHASGKCDPWEKQMERMESNSTR